MMKKTRFFATLFLVACGSSSDEMTPAPTGNTTPGNIVEVAAGNSDFSSLVAAVKRAGLVDALSAATPKKTVFAPTNAAFTTLLQQLGVASVDALSVAQLQAVLLYHVAGSEINAAAATTAAQGNQSVATLGGKIKLGLTGNDIQIDGRAKVTTADLPASNGIIHVIDQVLLPSVTDIVTTNASLTSLTAALTAVESTAGFVATLDNDAANPKFTVFAPNDAAFTALVNALKADSKTGVTALSSFQPYQLIPILKLHVAAAGALGGAAATAAGADVTTLGGAVKLKSANSNVYVVAGTDVKVTTADLVASNGIVHIIEGVLLPSIADVVVNNPEFSGLTSLVVQSSAVATALSGSDKFTLFAPNNAAVTAAAATAASLTAEQLTNVLLYHALPGDPVYAASALTLDMASVPTAFATHPVIVSGGSSVTVDDETAGAAANVTVVNYFTRNGVVHLIDKVLIPTL